MPAELVSLTDLVVAQSARLERLIGLRDEWYRRARQELRESTASDAGSILGAVEALSFAEMRIRRFLESRNARLERQLRKALNSDALTDEQRAELATDIQVRPGGQGIRWKHMLSGQEQALVDHYRAMDPAGRQMLRSLVERLAETSVQPEGTD